MTTLYKIKQTHRQS